MKHILTFFFALCCLVTIQSVAQVQSVSQSTAWWLLNQNIQLSKKWMIPVDEQFAFSDGNTGMQHMARIGISYNLPKGFQVVPIGYAYVWNYIYGKQPSAVVNNEQWVWEQVSYGHRVGRFGISHRVKLEERWIQNNQINSKGELVNNGYSNYQDRLRYRLMSNLAINKPTVGNGAYFLNAWVELFYCWGKAVQYHSINQTRAFIGIGYQANSNLSVVGGPYYQQLIKGTGIRQENNLGYQVQMTYLFNLSKKPS
jgi:hypothetical protein